SYALGSYFLGAGEQTIELSGTAMTCKTAAVLPKRVIPTEPIPIRIVRNCSRPTAGVIALKGSGTTYALFENNGVKVDELRVEATGESDRTQIKSELVELDASQSEYRLLLTADGGQASISVGRNQMGEWSAIGRAVILAAGALPALLGLLAGFYGDVRRVLETLFRSPVT
ncbi:MAG TPA: hypothetical protein VNO21_07555, partial [Polyangiaceae bacterium]|nr:hypothetical protein [Polyangiaceae bacterium]